MPNIAKVLKDEIARIARHETKSAIAPLRKPGRSLRRSAAELKKKVALLEQEVRSLQKRVAGLAGVQPGPEKGGRARVTAKGMRSLRRKLHLTGQEFAKLLGITPQVVYGWEKATGALRVRQKTRAAILAVREIGAREARRLLEQRKASPKRKKAAVKRARGKGTKR
jgi:DNA-binding XRE family transcriptional regulator